MSRVEQYNKVLFPLVLAVVAVAVDKLGLADLELDAEAVAQGVALIVAVFLAPRNSVPVSRD